MSVRSSDEGEPVAIIGLGCRFPGAEGPAAFWSLMERGGDSVGALPADREIAGAHSARGGFLEHIDRFDAEFFGISTREAERLDPQQRLLLEVTWEALETAGYAPNGLAGSRTGVYVGIGSPDYLRRILRWNPSAIDGQAFTGSLASVAAGRLAYVLGLQGPCMAIDTACSSSLVSVHQACQSLRSGESELALAGGVNLILAPENMSAVCKTRALSTEGRCKTFAAAADGFVRSEGCGMVVLKLMSKAQADGDRVLAVIRGSAVNQDGASSGFTVPNPNAQQLVMRRALG